MTTYTDADKQKVEDMGHRMPLTEVAEVTGIPYRTILNWSQRGEIDCPDWTHTQPSKYDDETIARADRLWDGMPLDDVADVLDMPASTLYTWARKGLIQTERDWRTEGKTSSPKADPRRAQQLVNLHGYTQREAAEKLGVCESTLSRYMNEY